MTTVAQDAFTGYVALTSHAADVGGTWSKWTGTSGTYALSAIIGSITADWLGLEAGYDAAGYAAGGDTGVWTLPVAAGDVDLYLTIAHPYANGVPSGAGVAFRVRPSGNKDCYFAYLDSGGTVWLSRYTNNAVTAVASYAVPGFSSGSAYRLHVQVSGSSPTTIKARAWLASGSEPGTWGINTTDNTAANQIATTGYVGVYGVAMYDEYEAWGDQITADDFLVTAAGASAPSWVSPADAANVSSSTPFVFTSLVAAKDGHFELQFDRVNTFDSGSLKRVRSYLDSGWEYWDGSAWQPLTAAGMPAAKTGNNVRWTPSPALASGTWYRRARQNT